MGKKTRYADSNNLFNDPLALAVVVILALLPIVMFPYSFDMYALPKVTFLYIATTVLIVGFTARAIKAGKLLLYRSVFDIPIALLLLVSTLSLVFSDMPILGIIGKYQQYETLPALFCYAIIYFIVVQLVRDEKSFERVLKVMTIGFIPVAIYGLLQAAGLDFPNVFRFETRVHSSLGNPVLFGAYLVIMLPLLLSLARNSNEERWRLLAWTLIVIGIIDLIFTESRGAWLGISVAAVAVFIRWRGNIALSKRMKTSRAKSSIQSKNRMRTVGLVLVIAVLLITSLIAIPGNYLKSRLVSTFSFSEGLAANRIETWRASLKMIADKPLLGYGPEQMNDWMPLYKAEKYASDSPRMLTEHAHNDFLQAALSGGIPGMLLYVWMFIMAILGLFRNKMAFRTSYMTGLFGAIIGYLAQAQTGITAVFLTPLIWSLLGIAGNIKYPTKEKKVIVMPGWLKLKPATPALVIVSVLVVLFTAKPVLADYYIYKGEELARSSPDQAVSYFERALALDPYQTEYRKDAVEFYLSYASLYNSTIYARQALLIADQGLIYNKRSFELTYYAGEANLVAYEITEDRTNLVQAKKYYKQAENLWPSLILTKKRLLEVANRENDSSSAIAIAEELEKLGDKDPRTYLILATNAQKNGDTKKAERYFRKVEELNPDFLLKKRGG
ncbi:MAG: O-antigen ligase family protein [Firmicutes bacterium]|nr:O-antigen ligase family protein [Bacillota bacterium]